jgi:hypothetical protein
MSLYPAPSSDNPTQQKTCFYSSLTSLTTQLHIEIKRNRTIVHYVRVLNSITVTNDFAAAHTLLCLHALLSWSMFGKILFLRQFCCLATLNFTATLEVFFKSVNGKKVHQLDVHILCIVITVCHVKMLMRTSSFSLIKQNSPWQCVRSTFPVYNEAHSSFKWPTAHTPYSIKPCRRSSKANFK